MKTDNYLNLCLEQAAQSPLFHRHGSIVVKGGKIIGQGFNDYRSGYDGGALKTGRLPAASFPLDDAVVSKRKPKSKLTDPPSASTFVPFERSAGGGGPANTCFSMHSEMMAINSALAASSTLAASTASFIKPHFKLSGRHSKPSLLRGNDAVKSYVERVCLDAMGPDFKQCTGANTNSNCNQNLNLNQNKKNGRKKNKNKEHLTAARKSNTKGGIHAGSQIYVLQRAHEHINTTVPTARKQQIVAPSQNHVLLPKGRARQTSRAVHDRMKHPKLVGADVYVTRLANSSPSPVQHPAGSAPMSRSALDDDPLFPATSSSTGSLHDELTCKTPTPAPLPLATCSPIRTAVDSRPCYRCVCYMHSVGIKRVFWTNGEGKWEGAKVRDLADMLEGSGSGGEGEVVSGLGVFVTKHEVLMLRRLLGS
ncbi:hypothetical protein B0T14DRAFT_559355 [Immersiella caudata]|uniref:CMP/dCMP-type deaminase domain-containing protein n=1 Tax=Immersiella caudata TaxID=314043 RepID=A0AA40CAH3_9PEZI|nr:hypothetical protein B0T14DRAFT_559355 [Immersiella caudata]